MRWQDGRKAGEGKRMGRRLIDGCSQEQHTTAWQANRSLA